MELRKIVDKLGLEVVAGARALSRDATCGYASDLLSDVMAGAGEGALWVTVQTHANIVAVSSLNGLAGVVVTRGKRPGEDTIAKAEEEGVALLVAEEDSFDVIGRLYKMGLRGKAR